MAVDMFIKLGDIKGEAHDKDHKDEIDVLSWSWGVTQSGGGHMGGGSGAGKVNVQDLTFVKNVDKATPNLMKHCCTGKHIKEALLTVRKAGGDKPVEYVKLKLEEVLITAVGGGGSPHDEKLTENVTLNFAKFTYDYQPQKTDGAADGGAITMSYNARDNTTT